MSLHSNMALTSKDFLQIYILQTIPCFPCISLPVTRYVSTKERIGGTIINSPKYDTVRIMEFSEKGRNSSCLSMTGIQLALNIIQSKNKHVVHLEEINWLFSEWSVFVDQCLWRICTLWSICRDENNERMNATVNWDYCVFRDRVMSRKKKGNIWSLLYSSTSIMSEKDTNEQTDRQCRTKESQWNEKFFFSNNNYTIWSNRLFDKKLRTVCTCII